MVRLFCYSFVEKTDIVSIDDREFQLVTWSKDRRLRLWPISDEILKVRSRSYLHLAFTD